jgi:hypothetical protein
MINEDFCSLATPPGGKKTINQGILLFKYQTHQPAQPVHKAEPTRFKWTAQPDI